jgi:hypothetical protein
MENYSSVKEQFNQKLESFQKEIQPALNENELKELVLYAKLIEIEEKISNLAKRLEK